MARVFFFKHVSFSQTVKSEESSSLSPEDEEIVRNIKEVLDQRIRSVKKTMFFAWALS